MFTAEKSTGRHESSAGAHRCQPVLASQLKTSFALSCVLATLAVCNSAAADWPQFRGNNSDGLGTGAPPVEFGPGKNEVWKTSLLPGHSSPCVFGDRIFVTTFDENQPALAVVCLDRTNGQEIWTHTVKVEAVEKGHPSFNAASSSPCCDGERVVAYFGSHGLVCLDLNGKQLWEKRLPLARSFGGNATSPVFAGDRVILYRGCYVDHYLLCVDKTTGDELWKVPQDEKFTGEMACTACPVIVGDRLICHSARSVQAFDIDSGNLLWIAKCATTATSTPVVTDNEVIVAAWNKLGEPDLRPPFPAFEALLKKHDTDGDKQINRKEFPKLWIFHRPEGAEAPQNGAPVSFKMADKNKDGSIDAAEWNRTTTGLEKFRSGYDSHGLLAIPVNSDGLVAADSVRKLSTQGIPEVPSPVFDGIHVYLVKNGGLLTCVHLESGRTVYRVRTKGTGTHYASPIIANGMVYTFAGNGRVSVIQAGDTPQVIAVNEMNDGVYATPAIVDGTIYLRTHSAIYAFAKAGE